MNREQAKALLPIIQALAEGKEVQYRWSHLESPWVDYTGNLQIAKFGTTGLEWRIKPEKKIGWIVILEDGIAGYNPQNKARGTIYASLADCFLHWGSTNKVAVVQITYEEGEGL